jgi:hypothetical protein
MGTLIDNETKNVNYFSMDGIFARDSGRSGRLLRKMIVCSCGIGFSVGTQLATLRRPAQRNGLQNFDKRGIFKENWRTGTRDNF